MSEHEVELTAEERDILLDPCACGHTLNDHGDLGGCWVCNDDGDRECWVTCEALMVERVGRVVAARLAAGGAATDEGLRAAVWPVVEYVNGMEAFYGHEDPFSDSDVIDTPSGAPDDDAALRWSDLLALRAAYERPDAAPAPTEATTCCCEVSPPEFGGLIPDRDCPIHGAADTAAEEPRTEAQTLLAAADELPGGMSSNGARQWLRDRADRLSRADEEAGS